MISSLAEQQNLFVRDILALEKDLKALNCIRLAQRDEGNELAFEIFGNLIPYLSRLIWHNLVVTVCWVYDLKGHRSIYWYLKQRRDSSPECAAEIESQLIRISALRDELRKVRKLRHKWIAHRDKETSETPETFWANSKLKFEDIEVLVVTVVEIVKRHCPIADLTDHGVGMLFHIVEDNPEIEKRRLDRQSW